MYQWLTPLKIKVPEGKYNHAKLFESVLNYFHVVTITKILNINLTRIEDIYGEDQLKKNCGLENELKSYLQ